MRRTPRAGFRSTTIQPLVAIVRLLSDGRKASAVTGRLVRRALHGGGQLAYRKPAVVLPDDLPGAVRELVPGLVLHSVAIRDPARLVERHREPERAAEARDVGANR